MFGLKTGGYEVNDDLCEALVHDRLSQPHASNLGGLLARERARPLGIPAYIYDAVSGGELTEVARITGIRDIERRSFCHVLNSRAMAIRYAQEKQSRISSRDGTLPDRSGENWPSSSPMESMIRPWAWTLAEMPPPRWATIRLSLL